LPPGTRIIYLHIPVQGFYLYTREPGGNRIEICSGGYLRFDPDDNPVIWTPESVTADWPAPASH
jgi:catechol 2,3-dioxygenase